MTSMGVAVVSGLRRTWRTAALVAVAAVACWCALAAGGAGEASAAKRVCGTWGGSYTLNVTDASCGTARRVLDRFDAGDRRLVPGANRMIDSQLPFRVGAWRCGGLQGHVLCIKGRWRSLQPPMGRPTIDAVLRIP